VEKFVEALAVLNEFATFCTVGENPILAARCREAANLLRGNKLNSDDDAIPSVGVCEALATVNESVAALSLDANNNDSYCCAAAAKCRETATALRDCIQ